MRTNKKDTLAKAMDDLIANGGTWAFLENEGNKHAIRLRLKTRCTPSIYKAHITYRQIKDENYLGQRIIADKGIF